MGVVRRNEVEEEEDSSSVEEEEEEKEREIGAKIPGLAPGTGIFGVLRPNAPRKSPNAGHAAPQMKIELLERKTTGSMLIALWTAFLVCIYYFVDSSTIRTDRLGLPPPATAAAFYEVPEAELVGVANYQPLTEAAGTNIFEFRGGVTVLPPDISVTDNEGANFTALQWFGTNIPGVTANRGSTWIWFIEYRDENGIQLSGENIRFEILAYVCWSHCESIGNWRAVFTDEASAFNRKIEVRETNGAGEPTVIRWDVVAYSEYTPSHENVCFGIRYTNDPGDATAGYRVFQENAYGQFGSCGAGDVVSSDSSDSNPLYSCMRMTQRSLTNEDYGRNQLALVAFIITAVCSVAWVYIIYRSPPQGWRAWNLQQKWTLVMAVGTMLFENPLQTIWIFYDNPENRPHLKRALECITAAGVTIVLLVAVFWADSARYRVLSASQFYVPKIAYAVTVYLAIYLGLLAVYPTREGAGNFWAASAWSWPEDRSALFVVAEASRLLLWLLGGLYYYYFLHCSFKFYNKVPYMLTRAEQLSFRFVVSTFSFFVMLAVLNVAARFIVAVVVTIDDIDQEASTITQASAFFKFMYGASIRSPVSMAFLSVAVLVFQFAFMPASAMQLSKYKPKYVRLESDVLRQAWRHRRSAMSFQRQGGNRSAATCIGTGAAGAPEGAAAAEGAVAAAGGAAAAAANVARGAAAAGHAANAAAHGATTKAATATAAATMGTVNVVDVVSATPERPLFVIERARWLAALSREAYRCFSEEELSIRSQKAADRLVMAAHLGCEVVAMLTEPMDNNLHDTHCLIVRHKVTRRLIVSFRGTISKKQMKTDIQGWKCNINLDLFALKTEKKKLSRFQLSRRAGQPSSLQHQKSAAAAVLQSGGNGPQQPALQGVASDGGSSSNGPAQGMQRSETSAARRVAKREGLRAHMATEDNMPQFLLHLASVLQVDVEAAGRSTAENTGAEVLAAGSSTATAAGNGAASPIGARNSASSAVGGEKDAAAPLEEGRRASFANAEAEDQEEVGGSMAAAATAVTDTTVYVAEPAARAGAAAAAAVEGATRLLREKAAAMHAQRLASKRARASRGRVHHGFWSSYSTVRERVITIVQRELLREPGQLYVTGHSLGGALATLCAYDMALWLLPVVNARLGRGPESTGEEHEEEIKCTMYNFGSPRVGDFFFANRYDLTVPHSYRVVCDGDIITGMPPKRFGYTHVGGMAVIDRTGCGSLLIDPSVLEARFKTSRTLNVSAHLFGPYIAALDGCLYPLETQEEVLSLIDAVYLNRSGGVWYGCACFWMCCDARLPVWLGCESCGKGATGAVGRSKYVEGDSETDSDADDMDTLMEKEPGADTNSVATVQQQQRQEGAADYAGSPRDGVLQDGHGLLA